MGKYEHTCICKNKNKYQNNCAHYLSNWMIKQGVIKERPSGTYCCPDGRPLRAKEMRTVFESVHGKPKHNPPIEGNCYIYVERQSDHQGHVYYGKKGDCQAGTGDGGFAGSDAYYEYYY